MNSCIYFSHILLDSSHICQSACHTYPFSVQLQRRYITSDICKMHGKNNLRCLPAYRLCNNRFLSCRGWPSYPSWSLGLLRIFLYLRTILPSWIQTVALAHQVQCISLWHLKPLPVVLDALAKFESHHHCHPLNLNLLESVGYLWLYKTIFNYHCTLLESTCIRKSKI